MSDIRQFSLREDDEYIKLGQALKAVGAVSNGVEAKFIIQDGFVLVNGEVETRRGKKLVPGDEVHVNGLEAGMYEDTDFIISE